MTTTGELMSNPCADARAECIAATASASATIDGGCSTVGGGSLVNALAVGCAAIALALFREDAPGGPGARVRCAWKLTLGSFGIASRLLALRAACGSAPAQAGRRI
jgi:hypothetical protein